MSHLNNLHCMHTLFWLGTWGTRVKKVLMSAVGLVLFSRSVSGSSRSSISMIDISCCSCAAAWLGVAFGFLNLGALSWTSVILVPLLTTSTLLETWTWGLLVKVRCTSSKARAWVGVQQQAVNQFRKWGGDAGNQVGKVDGVMVLRDKWTDLSKRVWEDEAQEIPRGLEVMCHWLRTKQMRKTPKDEKS